VTTPTFTAEDRRALADAARTIDESGMVPGASGNLSLRRGDRMLITPRGGDLGALDPLDLVDVSVVDGSTSPDHDRASRASSETDLHRATYAAAGAGEDAVVHTHAHYCTVVGTLVDELPAIHYAIAAFGGAVRVAPYETFGTPELAAAVGTALEGRTAALMSNHGMVVTGRDPRSAVAKAITLEWVASVYYHAIAAGREPRVLDADDLAAVVAQIKAIDYKIAA
jgi:L-fuculose-phosphate aldolase